MKLSMLAIAIAGLSIIGHGAGQAAKEAATPPPALKPEVRMAIRDAQWTETKLVLQQHQLEQQYREVSQQVATVDADLRAKLADALDKSGIDKRKWELNGDSLLVEPKGAAEARAKAAAQPAAGQPGQPAGPPEPKP